MKKFITSLLVFLLSISASALTLSWNDNSDNEEGFRIERSTDGVNFEEIAIVDVDIATYEDVGLPNGTYSYRVRAFNEYGNSGYTNTATGIVESGTPPSDPSDPTTVSNDDRVLIIERLPDGTIVITEVVATPSP